MKMLHRFLILTLCVFLLCGAAYAVTSGDNIDPPDDLPFTSDTETVIVRYHVSKDRIFAGEEVDVTVWLDLSAEVDASSPKITPMVCSFNEILSITPCEPDNGYLPVKFSGAVYQGVGNTFEFRVGSEYLSLTIHECEPSSELQEPSDATKPYLQIGRTDQAAPIAKGETQTIGLWVHNPSSFDLVDVIATVTPSSELQIADNSMNYNLGSIWDGHTAFFDVALRAYGDVTTAAQSVEVSLLYTYEKDGSLLQESHSQSVPLSAIVSRETDGMAASVPNVIISGYDYGADKVMAGTSFDLKLQFRNTSVAQQVENIVMTIDPGTALAITSSANSFHFARLSPGAVLEQTLNLQALPDAPSAPAAIRIGFSYEYLDGDMRKTATMEQTISLPVYQLDRFELTQNSTSVEAWQYEECFVTLNYLNKGKGTVYNVSATVSGDVTAMETVQNIGNVESGRSGTIDFILTPETAGSSTFTITVTYEDEAMQVMTNEFTFDMFVNEAYVPEFLPEEIPMEEPQTQSSTGWIIGGGAAALLAGGGITVPLVIRRKKKKANVIDTFVFDDEEDSHASV